MMNSVAATCKNKAIGGILTGMGTDGAQGLLELYSSGGETFIQDENSSIVYGMPEAALNLGAVKKVLHLDKIAQHIVNLSLIA